MARRAGFARDHMEKSFLEEAPVLLVVFTVHASEHEPKPY